MSFRRLWAFLKRLFRRQKPDELNSYLYSPELSRRLREQMRSLCRFRQFDDDKAQKSVEDQ